MSNDEIEKKMEEVENKMDAAENSFSKAVEDLQKTYESLQAKYDEEVVAIKAESDYKTLKAVSAFQIQKNGRGDEL